MKKTLKRILATFLTVIMLFSALPLAGINLKASALASSGKCGDNVYWNFDSSTGTLTISGTGDMYDYQWNESPFSVELLIEDVIIKKGVTSIGKAAFDTCNNLKKITIPDSITNIENYAFENCVSLTNIIIPNSVKNIGDYAFEGCTNLESIDISDEIEKIGNGAFYECENLINIEIPYGITNIGFDTFSHCISLTNITIPNSVVSIGEYAFYNCSYLKSITIPDSVKSIGHHAFKDCESLINIKIPDGITNIYESTFEYCCSLVSIIIPSSITNIEDYAFDYCVSLKDVFYSGSQSQWNKVTINDYNEYLTNAIIHYNATSTYTVTYNANGGSISPTSATVESGKSITLPTPNARTGYTCLGWSTSKTATSATYSCGASYKPTANVTLYAVWKQNPIKYTVTFNGNGGTVSPTSTIVESGKSITLPTPNARTGYTCLGWSTSSSATSATYSCGASYKPTANVTLYAVWKQNPIKYTVTFNGNGGTVSPTSTIVESGKSITLPTPNARTGYTCLGWSTSKTATSAIYSCGASYKPTANVTLYAVWKQNPIKYTVTFNGNGGTVSPTSIIVESGKSITLPTPNTRTGYTCLGWSTSKTATSATYSCGASHKPTSNVTLYAVWKQNPTTNIYNIGEETYSFKNYSDRGSTGGHCFGMSITSAGYYLGMLNPSTIGIGSSDKLYSVSDTNRVREPICYYQHIQGNYTGNAIVAGTTTYYNAYYNAGKSSRQCWNECVDYVKSHNYDNKGTLQIQFWKTVNSGHAVNFLYYKNVNGQDRLYVYDNNYPNPDSEVYLYLGNNGKIYEAPKATYGINTYVETICLVDMNKYFQYAKGYNPSSYIFAKAGSINVEGAIAYPMACGEEEMFMYEIPDFAPKITIKPLINNAEFEYMEEAYNFNKVDNDTYGVLSMPAPETSGEHSSLFKVFNEPNALNLKDIELKYKDTAKITPNFNYDDAGDYTVKYESSDTSVATVDKNGNISTIHKGTTTITCTVTDEYGNTVKDTCTVTVKFQWWQWLIWILLFGFLWY